MPGEPEPLYGLARRVLLDGLEALQAHQPALVLVGAQAIYLHTQETELALAPYTTDADLVLNPPQLEIARRAHDGGGIPARLATWDLGDHPRSGGTARGRRF